MYDLVMPKGNENVLIQRAKTLSVTPVLVYEFARLLEVVKKKNEFPDQLIGALIRFEGQKSVRLAKELKKKVDVVVGSANFKEPSVRQIVSCKHFDFLINACSSGGKMHTHYQYSNINQVIAKLACDNGVAYCVDLSHILRNYSEKRAMLMSRIMQNIKIFKKYRVPIAIASFAVDKYSMRNSRFFKAMLRIMKYPAPKDVIRSLISEKFKKSTIEYIKKGVRVIE